MLDFRRHLLEPLLGAPDQIHLVDRDQDLLDAEKMEKIGMAPGLFLNPLVGIDHEHRRVGLSGAADHVLDELAMTRRVDQNVLPLRRPEVNVRDVDGDPLVALRLQRVHQKGPLERHAAALAHRLDGVDLAFRKRTRIVEQPPDHARLAVIDMADHHDLEGRPGLDRQVPRQIHLVHVYMYPAARSRSKASSLS